MPEFAPTTATTTKSVVTGVAVAWQGAGGCSYAISDVSMCIKCNGVNCGYRISSDGICGNSNILTSIT